jgi:hypothetical protein
MRSTFDMLVANRLGTLGQWDAVPWAYELLEHEPSADRRALLLQIADAYPVNASALEALLRQLAPEIRLSHVLKHVMAEHCRRLLKGQTTPQQFGYLVKHIDAELLDSGEHELWIARLWNTCDWSIEPDATLAELPFLKDAAQELVAEVDRDATSTRASDS